MASPLREFEALSLDRGVFAGVPGSDGLSAPTAATYWRTLRYLRWSQLGHLALRRALPRSNSPAKISSPVGLRRVPNPWPFTDWQSETSRQILAERQFTFLNRTVRCKDTIPWNDCRYPKLWLYHLNYCDFLNVRLALPEEEWLLDAAVESALDWSRQNAQGTEVGWEPYALSVRVVNWLKFLGRYRREVELLRGAATLRALLESVGSQAATLQGRLEKGLLGNHLLKNVKALLFAGAMLETSRSGRWWTEGEKLLQRELDEQVLPDGGHFERSPMYHAQALEDVADIERLCAYTGRQLCCSRLLASKVRSMGEFLKGIAHPDGAIPLFNDSARGGTRPVGELLAMAGVKEIAAPASEPSLFPYTGYGVIRDAERGCALIFDAGPLGPDYQPGHGHCDVLSYELSLHGRRVVVDTGVTSYERTPERVYERSTAAHNTLRIDGEEQAEVWACFRVGRRPEVGRLEGGCVGPCLFVDGEHYAYQHRGVVHARRVALMGGVWLVIDLLKGQGRHRAESFIHFHPLVGVREFDLAADVTEGIPRRRWRLDAIDRTYSLVAYGEGEFNLYWSWCAEQFGRRQDVAVLRWIWEGHVPWVMVYAFVPEDVPIPRVELDAARHAVEINGQRIRLR